MSQFINTAIGAVGVLAGVSITGGFTLLKGRQENRAKALDLQEQRSARHRETRREAYVRFLTQLSMVEQSSKAIWKRPFRDMATTEGPEAELLEYSSLVDALHKDFDIVCLEGPGNVANSARRLLEDTLEERSVLTRTVIEALMNITPENQGFTLSRSPASTSEDFQEIMTRRLEKRYDFLLEARNAL